MSVQSNQRTLQRGMKGDDVKSLQSLLNYKMSAGLAVDGDFGPSTEAAVKRFQQSAGLTVDGIVGPRTWLSLNR